MIKHLSFDVWKTLILPNPEFGKARLRLLAAELSMPVDKVEAVYRRLKDGYDTMAELTGAGASSSEIYDQFMAELGRPDYNWWSLRRGLEDLFAKYPPLVLPEVGESLRRAQAAGYTLSIGSNTNFIRGEVLNEVTLSQLGVEWAYQVYSDQVCKSKPHPAFWRVVTERALAHTDAKAHEIAHVGDNRTCDGGCVSAGMTYHYVSGPADLTRALEGIYEKAAA